MRFSLLCVALFFACICQSTANNGENQQIVYPNPDGRACSRVDSGTQNFGLVRVSANKAVKMTLRMPVNWKPGTYVCSWKLEAITSAGDVTDKTKKELGLKVEFSSRMHWTTNYEQRREIGRITLGVPDLEFTYEEFEFTKYWFGDGIYNTPNHAEIKLRLNVIQNDQSYDNETFFVDVSVDKVPRWPKRFKVDQIKALKGLSRSMKNYFFTWSDARKFCKKQLPGWDLCSTNDLFTCEGRAGFSHSSIDQSIQYFPVLVYNQWAKVVVNTSECSDGPDATNGPPPWGVSRRKCPEEGCESKTYIYCCLEEAQLARSGKLLNIQSKLVDVYVSSGRSSTGQYHYRFAWESDEKFEIDYGYYDDLNSEQWRDYWKPAGRIPGDIRKFQIYSTFSTRSRTAVYFCHKVINDNEDIENYRYMVSLTPCVQPWKFASYAYAHTKPRRTLRPIYFGQSPNGEGTRVSLTPPCCGFDDPEQSFILYARVKKDWEQEVSSRFCREVEEFTGRNGTLSSENLLTSSPSSPLYCSWRISVRKGYGISVQYSYKTPELYSCSFNQDYLGFWNRNSKRIYGRSCDDETKTFLTDSNVLDIEFVVEDTNLPSFLLTYEEVPNPAPLPIKFKVDSNTGAWDRAKKICLENGLHLCSKVDLCPIGNYPAGGIQSKPAWIAVNEEINAWIYSGTGLDKNEACMLHSTMNGPPIWGMEDLKTTNATSIRRDVVFCCNRPQAALPTPEPVFVIVGMNNRFDNEYYWFNRTEEWESPSYMFHYDDPYHAEYSDLERVYPWRPPSTFAGAAANAADYFSMSSHYEKGHFEQVVYFCKRSPFLGSPQATLFEDYYILSLNHCERPSWVYDFHLYAGRQISQKATAKFHVGQSDVYTDNNMGVETGYSCCKNNPHQFVIYVIDAGKVDSYVHPTSNSTNDDYDY